jgi:predicted nucleic acid-binding protein
VSINKVVINTSPLIVLFKSQLIDILPQVCREIIIPNAVWSEVVKAGKNDLPSQQLPQITWGKKVDLISISPTITSWGLDPGETEVLSFAWENKGYRVIIDDAAGRRVARTLNIPFIGTVGLLLVAKQQGMLDSMTLAIQSLKDSGLWLSDDLVKYLIEEAGE